MLITFLDIVHVGVCAFLILVVLLQQGKGGGMGAAFGGGAQQVFGGRGAGNILTRATAVCATIFMLTSVLLAWLPTRADHDLKAKAMEEILDRQRKGKGNDGTRVKPTKPSATPADTAPGAGGH